MLGQKLRVYWGNFERMLAYLPRSGPLACRRKHNRREPYDPRRSPLFYGGDLALLQRKRNEPAAVSRLEM